MSGREDDNNNNNVTDNYSDRLREAVNDGDTETVKLLLEEGANVNQFDMEGWTLLHDAIRMNRIEICKLLLEKGANVNQFDMEGWTPLHVATRINRIEICKLLLEKGAEVNPVTKSGRFAGLTPLHVATRWNRKLEICKLLLEKGANPNQEIEHGENYRNTFNDNGNTPLWEAADQSRIEIVKLLLEKRGNPNIRNGNGFTPLFQAAWRGREDVVNLLLDHGADLTKLSDRQRSYVPRIYTPVKECAICLNSLSNNGVVVRTPCGHLFHEECLGRWISTDPTCPTCRKVLTVDADGMSKNIFGDATGGYRLCKNIVNNLKF